MSFSFYHHINSDTSDEFTNDAVAAIAEYVEAELAPLRYEIFIILIALQFLILAIMVLTVLLYRSNIPRGHQNDELEPDTEED